MSLKNYLIIAIIAFCSTHMCDGIKCYDCRSDIDPHHCGKDFSDGKNVKQVDCSTNTRPIGFESAPIPTACSTTAYNDFAGDTYVRGCHYVRPDQRNECTIDSTSRKIIKCENCKTDLCNSASKQYFTIIGTIISVVLAGIFTL